MIDALAAGQFGGPCLLGQLTPLVADFGAIVRCPLFWAVLAGTVGIWLVLPRGGRFGRIVGSLIAAAGLVLLAVELPRSSDLVQQVLFWLMAGMTAVGAVATISMRSPIYSAIWFGLTLLATGGLFLIQGAQLLGVATVVVYAGAILVTFLFLLMLAQPQGHAYYDRISWGRIAPAVASLCGVVVIGGLTYVFTNVDFAQLPSSGDAAAVNKARADVLDADQHAAKMGGQLFSRHLISIEVAGALLMVALVGAIVMTMRSRERQPTDVGDAARVAEPRPQRPSHQDPNRKGSQPGGATDG